MSIIPRLSPPSVAPIGDPFVAVSLWDEADYTLGADETLFADASGADGGGALFVVDALYPFAGTFTNDGVAWARGNGAYLFSAMYAGEIANNGIAVAESTTNLQAVVYYIGGLFTGLTNTGGIYAYGEHAPAYGIWDYSGYLAPIVNSGTIAALADPLYGQASAIMRTQGGSVENRAGGEILAEGGFVRAVMIEAGRNGNPGDPAEIINAGRIEAHSTNPDSPSFAIAGHHAAHTTLNVENSGLIKGDIAIDIAHYPYDAFSNVSETVTNSATGIIDGIIALHTGDDLILNDGRIIGDILLGEGADTYDGSGGRLDGAAHGGAGNDLLIGGAGDDRLDGGTGDDRLDGGAGADTAIFAGDRADYLTAADGGTVTLVSAGEGTDTISNVERFAFADGTWSLAELAASASLGAPQYLLGMADSMAASIARTGTVIGTDGVQDVTVLDLPGRVTFDSSFNGGGDRIRLSGDAADYTVVRDGSRIEIGDGDTVIAVPAGIVGADIVFDDGSRTITVEAASGTIRLGDQVVTTSAAAIEAAAQAPNAVGAIDAEAGGRLVMADEGVASFGGNAFVFGSPAAAAAVTVIAGSTLRFDGSVNAGGDTIALPGAPGDYEAVLSGSMAVLTADDVHVEIPFGLAPTAVSFEGIARALFYDDVNYNVMLGDQVLYTFPVQVVPNAFGADTIDAAMMAPGAPADPLAPLPDGGLPVL